MSSAEHVMPGRKSLGSGRSFTRNSFLVRAVRRQHLKLSRRQLAIFADRKVADRHSPDLSPNQLQHLASDGFDHAAHLPIAALANNDFDKGVFSGIADALYDGRLRWPVVEDYAFFQLLDLRIGEMRRGLHQIGLWNLVVRIGYQFGKARIVGEK